MEKKKMIILGVIIAILGVIIIVVTIINKNKDNGIDTSDLQEFVTYEKKDDSLGYVIEEKNSMNMTVENESNSDAVYGINSNNNIVIEKVSINMASDDAKSLNRILLEYYNKSVQNITNDALVDKTTLCSTLVTQDCDTYADSMVKVKKGGNYYYISNSDYYTYYIEENTSFIFIIVEHHVKTFGSDAVVSAEPYTISKVSGEFITNEYILADDTMDDVADKYAKSLGYDEDSDEYIYIYNKVVNINKIYLTSKGDIGVILNNDTGTYTVYTYER